MVEFLTSLPAYLEQGRWKQSGGTFQLPPRSIRTARAYYVHTMICIEVFSFLNQMSSYDKVAVDKRV